MSFVAISTVSYPASLEQDIYEVGKMMLPIARRQPGFIAIAFHRSCDEQATMMYWEWETRQHHEACMASDDWMLIMEQSQALFSDEDVQFSLQTFERLA